MKMIKYIGYAVGIYLLLMGVFLGILYLVSDSGESPDTQEDQITAIGNVSANLPEGELIPEWAPSLGSEDAQITIVEFSDFKCPFCKAASPHIRRFVAKNQEKVRYIYRHLPLEEIHPGALELSQASMCAHDQDKFWPVHDLFFQKQDQIQGRGDINEIVKQAGVDINLFARCMSEQPHQEAILQDRSDAIRVGGRGTPTWMVNGQRIQGIITFDQWETLIERLEQ